MRKTKWNKSTSAVSWKSLVIRMQQKSNYANNVNKFTRKNRLEAFSQNSVPSIIFPFVGARLITLLPWTKLFSFKANCGRSWNRFKWQSLSFSFIYSELCLSRGCVLSIFVIIVISHFYSRDILNYSCLFVI